MRLTGRSIAKMIEVRKYNPQLRHDWERLVDSSSNAIFQHSRSFMEYHGNRFEDRSVIIYHHSQPKAIFPSHRIGDRIFSHKGLTYGGLVVHKGLQPDELESFLQELVRYYKKEKITEIHLKCLPDFYADGNQQALKESILKVGGRKTGEDIIHAVPLPNGIKERALYKIRNSQRITPEIKKAESFQLFWEKVLIPHLDLKFDNRPVHSLQEITQLGQNNPLEQWDLYHEGELLAGTTLFVDKHVVKAQYTATTERGRKLKALDYLFFHLFDLFSHKKLFSLGTSYHPGTRELVPGLVQWKESFGAVPFESEEYVVMIR